MGQAILRGIGMSGIGDFAHNEPLNRKRNNSTAKCLGNIANGTVLPFDCFLKAFNGFAIDRPRVVML